MEKEFEPSLVSVRDEQKGGEDPTWVRGSVPIESADGNRHESRNRGNTVPLWEVEDKPYCDGSHWMNSQQKDQVQEKAGITRALNFEFIGH